MISVCIIGKNEEKNLDICLQALQKLNCEIIFTDTGSTDSTKSIAKRYTKNVYEFTWNNNFSDARNFCIAKAKTDIVLNIDCDEVIQSCAYAGLERMISKKPDQIGRICIQNTFTRNNANFESKEYVSRLFNRQYFHYTGCIHEQISPIPTASNIQSYKIPSDILYLKHNGYNGSNLIDKCNRNISLLLNEYHKNPTDAYVLYQLGKSYYMMKDYDNAYHYFSEGLSQDVDPALDYVQDMVESYGYTMLNSNRIQEAYQFKNIHDTFAKTADFIFLMGLIYMNNEKYNEAIQEFKKATNTSSHKVKGVNSFLSYYNIGVIYECLGDVSHALMYYRKCPHYAPAEQRIQLIKNS